MRSHRLITGLVVARGTVGVLGKTTPPASTQPNTISTCNQWHVVGAGDTCTQLETTHGLTRTQFLTWNPDVNNDCSVNFWAGYAYCVGAPPASIQPKTIATCNLWHVVATGDSCVEIEIANNITHAQFTAWNPDVSNDCVSGFWGGYAYCVGAPPASTQPNTAANCKKWQVAGTRDDCSTLEAANGITRAQFLALNPSVSSDCTVNFWAGYAYCIGTDSASSSSTVSSPARSTTSPPSSSSAVSSQPSTITSGPSSTISMPPYTFLHPITSHNITMPSIDTAYPPTKTQYGQPSYCNEWHLVLPGETCHHIAAKYTDWMRLEDMHAWNPALGVDCSGLYVYHWLCVGIQPQTSLTIDWATNATVELPPYATWTEPPIPTEVFEPFTPTPTQAALPTDCMAWYMARPNQNCSGILEDNEGLTEAQFMAWHPFLSGDCNGLWANNYYCVWAGPTPPPASETENVTSSAPITTTGLVPPRRWCPDALMFRGRMSRNLIPLENLLIWNPTALSESTCDTDLVSAQALCVSAPGGITVSYTSTPTGPEYESSSVPVSTSASSLSSTSSAPAVVSTPMPVMNNMVSSCRRFYLVQSADGCWAIANSAGIDLDTEFYVWNPDIGSQCENLWLNYYVCIGVAGPTTTIFVAPPVPT